MSGPWPLEICFASFSSSSFFLVAVVFFGAYRPVWSKLTKLTHTHTQAPTNPFHHSIQPINYLTNCLTNQQNQPSPQQTSNRNRPGEAKHTETQRERERGELKPTTRCTRPYNVQYNSNYRTTVITVIE